MRRRGGFTLIELLVVISIIALLIAILLPAIQSAKVVAGQSICLSGARQTAIAVRLYAEEWREYFPANTADPSDPMNPGVGPLPDRLYGYHNVLVNGGYAAAALFTSKSCPHGPTTYNPSAGDSIRVGSWTGPPNPDTYRPVTSYGLLPLLQGGKGRVTTFAPYHSGPSGVFYGHQKLSMKRLARFPDKVVVIACHGAAGARSYSSTFAGFARGLVHMVGEKPPGNTEIIDGRWIRHGARGLPMVMADGHGQVTPKKEIWDDIGPDNNRPYIDPDSVMYYSFIDLYDPQRTIDN